MKSKKLTKGTIIEIYWFDALSEGGWQAIKDFDKLYPPLCKTIGYFQYCKKEKGKPLWMVVSHSLNDSANEADYTIIPYGMIQRIERIE
jgi:hypothetical protein